jgi:hypothetical protein
VVEVWKVQCKRNRKEESIAACPEERAMKVMHAARPQPEGLLGVQGLGKVRRNRNEERIGAHLEGGDGSGGKVALEER